VKVKPSSPLISTDISLDFSVMFTYKIDESRLSPLPTIIQHVYEGGIVKVVKYVFGFLKNSKQVCDIGISIRVKKGVPSP
jgi:hypothetical protein